MPTIGLNVMQQSALAKLFGKREEFTTEEVKGFALEIDATVESVHAFLPGAVADVAEDDGLSSELADVNAELASKKEELEVANAVIAEKQEQLASANDVIVERVEEIEALSNKTPLAPKQLWDVYSEAVGGKTFDDKPLPEFAKLGKQQKGWVALTQFVNQ